MTNFKFTVHCLVKNEDIWVKAAIESVLPFAEKIFVFDTGSTDKTVEEIKSIQSPKIIFEKKGATDHFGLVNLRREMIKKTTTDWLLILDGDEIWPEKELEKLIKKAQSAPENVVALVNRNKNCVGDVYHYLPEESAHYELAGRRGNLTIRMIRKTKSLTISGEFPLETFADENGPLQSQDTNLVFADCWYLHTSHLQRSSLAIPRRSESFAKNKIWEKGRVLEFANLPEVLQKNNKNSVQLKKRGVMYELGSYLTTPVINLKRKLRK
jgi:glycosyltransferase involved in cell wall biosynthesis